VFNGVEEHILVLKQL